MNNSMNKMMYTKSNVNKFLYKTLTTTNFNLKNMRFLSKSAKYKDEWVGLPHLLCDISSW